MSFQDQGPVLSSELLLPQEPRAGGLLCSTSVSPKLFAGAEVIQECLEALRSKPCDLCSTLVCQMKPLVMLIKNFSDVL